MTVDTEPAQPETTAALDVAALDVADELVFVRRGLRTAQTRREYTDKIDALFKGRTFDVVREVHLAEHQVFRTATGHTARHGYVLRDRANGQELAVGATTLKTIHDRYLSVTLPPELRPKPRRQDASVRERRRPRQPRSG